MLWGTLAISVVNIISDLLLKQAANTKNMWLFVIAALTYVGGAWLWYEVYKIGKFSTVGIVYSIFTIILSVTIGLTFFKENIGTKEIVGIGLGVVSIVLLSRYG